MGWGWGVGVSRKKTAHTKDLERWKHTHKVLLVNARGGGSCLLELALVLGLHLSGGGRCILREEGGGGSEVQVLLAACGMMDDRGAPHGVRGRKREVEGANKQRETKKREKPPPHTR